MADLELVLGEIFGQYFVLMHFNVHHFTPARTKRNANETVYHEKDLVMLHFYKLKKSSNKQIMAFVTVKIRGSENTFFHHSKIKQAHNTISSYSCEN